MGGMNNPPGTPRDDGEMGGNFLNPFQSESVSGVNNISQPFNSGPLCPDSPVEECKHYCFSQHLSYIELFDFIVKLIHLVDA